MAISKKLVVQFLGDSSQLQGVYSTVTKDAQKFNKEIKNHGVSMQAVGKTMLAVGGTIVGALAATVVAVSKTGVEIDKMSKTTGVSREEIQKLGYAALQEHASMEQLSNGLVKLSKNMYDAKMGTGEAKDTFEELGISVKKSDGTLRNSSDVLLDVAEKFKGMTNVTEMSGAAMKLFGKSGAELVPFLRMGRDGIEELKKEAERLGIVMSEDSVKNMKAFDDSITAVKAGVGGFATQIASTLVPYLKSLADGLKTALEWFNQIPGPVRQAITVGTALAGVLLLATGASITFGGALWTAIAPIAPFILAAGALVAATTSLYNNWDKFVKFIDSGWGKAALLALSALTLGASNLVIAAVAVLKNWNNVAAFFMTAFDKAAGAVEIAWGGIRVYILGQIDLILKGLQTFTGWIPGWGDKLKGAITAIEGQIHSAVNDIQTGWQGVTQSRYQEHYDWMVARNKKKNTDIQTQENESNNYKNQKSKEQLDKEKKDAEERVNNEKEAYEKLFTETHNALENINHEEQLALSKANMTEKAKTDTRAYYAQKRLDLAKEEAKKRLEIEESSDTKLKADTISNLNEIANDETKGNNQRIMALQRSLTLQLQLRQKEYKKEKTEAEKAGADTTKITADYNLDIEQLYKNTTAKQAAILKASADKKEAIAEKANDEYLDEMQDTYQRDASNSSLSDNERITALKKLRNKELRDLEKWYKKEQKAADGNDKALKKLDKTYAAQKIKIIDDTESEIQDINQTTADKYGEQAATIVGYLDQISTGEKSAKEISQDLVVNQMSTREEETIASGLAGIADAWATYGYAAIPLIATITATTAASVAGWEVAKAAVRGLAEGGETTGPSLALIGEGEYREAVLPLSDDTFERIGKGIVSNSTNNTTNNNSNPTVVNNDNRTYQLGRYVDKSGLKKFVRDIQPIITSEEKRTGKK
jgi:hypothetical protein